MIPTMDLAGNNKRIIKNTIMLYVRMIVIMIVTLYTSRVVLHLLGEEDYGIYNVVGTIVVSLVFVQNSLVSATQRFLSYEIGRKNKENIRRAFSMSINIQFILIAVLLVLFETIGLWLLNNVLVIPSERLHAANVAYQLSILTFCVNIIRTPYNALIISFEKMNIYAWLSIVEALLKLSVVFLLKIEGIDKLIIYSFLVFIVTVVINTFYIIYCNYEYRQVCKYRFEKDWELLKEMFSFSGWNLLGGASGAIVHEGPSYFMNVFLGVRVNAAMGIAKQVSSAVYNFSSNFQTAFNPQIVKSYASGEFEYLKDLVKKSSIVSFFLISVFAIPIILCADTIFGLWLVEVPKYAIEFSVLLMIAQMITAVASPLWMLAHAIGDIKQYQLVLTFINCINLPVSWLILKMNLEPYYILAFQIVLSICAFAYRMFYLRKRMSFSVKVFLKDVVLKCILMTIVIVPVPYLLAEMVPGVAGCFITAVFSTLICIIVFFFIGFNKNERSQIVAYLKVFFRQKIVQ